ncbi:MAG: hypothetical protein ABMB14_09610 [Myxococcota bacterium]
MLFALYGIDAAVAADDARSFAERVDEEAALLQPVLDAAERRTLAGDSAGATRAIVAHATSRGTPEAWFIAGNIAWLRDPAASFELHRRAWEALPTEPEVNLEWALELHRAGHCDRAIPSYQLWLAIQPEDPAGWGLAHCALVIGDVATAMAALRAVPSSTHVEGESLLAEIHAPLDPWTVRDRLLTEARAHGEPVAWLSVVAWDLSFPVDPWNTIVSTQALTVDLASARTALAGHPALTDIEDLAAAKQGDPAAGVRLAERYRSKLPASADLAEQVLVWMLAQAPAKRVLARYRKDLTAREDAGDALALFLHAALVSEARPDHLTGLDRRGCALGLHNFCASAAAIHDTDPGTQLDALRSRFPHDPRFDALALVRAGATPEPAVLVDWLVDAPRLSPDAPAFAAGIASLDDLAAGVPIDPVRLGILTGAWEASLQPRPTCGPWEVAELRSSRVCEDEAAP